MAYLVAPFILTTLYVFLGWDVRKQPLSIRYYDQDFRPVRCSYCESTNLKEKVTDRMDWITLETSTYCQDCGALVGEWAHGYYNPEFIETVVAIGDEYPVKAIQAHEKAFVGAVV